MPLPPSMPAGPCACRFPPSSQARRFTRITLRRAQGR
jgi:hypothetical protein